jgi:hypothetical protein
MKTFSLISTICAGIAKVVCLNIFFQLVVTCTMPTTKIKCKFAFRFAIHKYSLYKTKKKKNERFATTKNISSQ